MLQIQDLTVFNQASLPLLENISFSLSAGELIAVTGVNGSGKTELASAISGHNRYEAKNATYNGTKLQGLSPFKIAELGIIFISEERQIFPNLSVENHLKIGGLIKSLFPSKKEINDQLEYIYSIFPKLYDRRHQMAVTLSGGEQQMLCIGRSLMSKPTCLILDEPTQGLSAQIANDFIEKLVYFKTQGLSIILIEQGLHNISSIADKIIDLSPIQMEPLLNKVI